MSLSELESQYQESTLACLGVYLGVLHEACSSHFRYVGNLSLIEISRGCYQLCYSANYVNGVLTNGKTVAVGCLDALLSRSGRTF